MSNGVEEVCAKEINHVKGGALKLTSGSYSGSHKQRTLP